MRYPQAASPVIELLEVKQLELERLHEIKSQSKHFIFEESDEASSNSDIADSSA
jgi:hypothetical protein